MSFKSIVLLLSAVLFLPDMVLAHCDTLDGPVVKAAKRALETGNVNLVLIWVQPVDEAAIRDAFAATLTVRKLGPQVEAFADQSFFETVVRIHRAGEGAPFAGLKPAGSISPAITGADQALQSGDLERLKMELSAGFVDSLDALYRKVV